MSDIEEFPGIRAAAHGEIDPFDRDMQHELLTMLVQAYRSAINPMQVGTIRGDGRIVTRAGERQRRESRMQAVAFLTHLLDEQSISLEGIPWIDRTESAVETGIDPITQDRVYRPL
jgi:hypothetical protein